MGWRFRESVAGRPANHERHLQHLEASVEAGRVDIVRVVVGRMLLFIAVHVGHPRRYSS